MDGRLRDDGVVVGGDARQRFHDARGYGRPLEGNEVLLSRVEAAHLLFRGDLDRVDGMEFRAFLARSTAAGEAGPEADAERPAGSPPAGGRPAPGGFGARFLVYADLRDRGFYLSPAREDRVADAGGADLVVYPRGKGPWDDAVRYRVRVVGERASVPATALLGAARAATGGSDDGDEATDAVLAVVDEESEITYFETGVPELDGEAAGGPPAGVIATLFDDRVVAWDPPPALHDRRFYGRPLEGRAADAGAVQLSLVEAAYLAAEGRLDLVAPAADGSAEPVERGVEAVVERGRAVEGDRFDRRLVAYRALREAGLVPKTGFKFGADFRVYREFESVEDVGHSELLVRVLPAGHAFAPRDLALDVRLAAGVRKRMTFALVDGDAVEWLAVGRLTP